MYNQKKQFDPHKWATAIAVLLLAIAACCFILAAAYSIYAEAKGTKLDNENLRIELKRCQLEKIHAKILENAPQ